jgi:hypothetical protein
MNLGHMKEWPPPRFRKKQSQGGGGHEKAPVSEEHVKELRPHELDASQRNGRQPTSATERSVASPAVPPTDCYEAWSAVGHSSCETLVDPKSALENSERNQTASELDASLLNIADPERIQPSSMSDPSLLHIKDGETTLLSKPNDIPLCPREPEGLNSPLDLQGLEQNNFPASVEVSSPKTCFETTDILPLNSEDPETGNSPKFIPDNSPNDHVAVLSNPIGNAQVSESVRDEQYRPESIMDRQDHHTPSSGSSNYSEPVLDTTEHLEPVFDTSEHPGPVFDTTDHPGIILEEPDYLQPISEGQDHTEPLSKSKEPDSSEYIYDGENYPEPIPDTQSRSESIKSHETFKGRDQQPHVRREARLHRFRWRSLMTRASVSERRTELHQVRSEMNDADAEFIKLSRQSWVDGSHNDLVLEASFKKLQAIRDRYGPLEEAYNRLEEQLDREEYELAELEEKMFKNGVPIPENHDSDLESQSDSSDESDSENLETIIEQQDPLYKAYVSRLGDASLCREAYADLMHEHDSLLEALEASQRYGRELLPEDQTTLAKFYAKEAKMSEELKQIGADVERLRLECIRKGLLAEDEDGDILQTSDGVVGPEQAEYIKYPHLLERPGEDEDEKTSKELLSGFASGDTGDRITRWLLHKLRSSCSEVELLKRFTPGLDRTVDTDKWQQEVLYFWFVDSANLPPSAYELEPTLTAFSSSRLTDSNRAPPKVFGEKQFIQLVVRSSSLSRSLEFGMWLKLAQLKGRSAVTCN